MCPLAYLKKILFNIFFILFLIAHFHSEYLGFPGGLVVKNLPANAGDARDTGLIPGSGRSPGEGNGNPLQYSCLENPMNRGAWQVTVRGVAKSLTQLSVCAHTHVCH